VKAFHAAKADFRGGVLTSRAEPENVAIALSRRDEAEFAAGK